MDRIGRVLLATDFSAASDNALEHAAIVAAKNGAELHVIHVRVPFPDSDPLSRRREFPGRQYYRGVLDRFVSEDPRQRPGSSIAIKTMYVEAGDPVTGILPYVRDNDIGLVVIGTHGRSGLSYALLGSVAARLVRLSPVSVLVVGREPSHKLESHRYERILVPIDFSSTSVESLRQAAAIARQHEAKLSALYVVNPYPGPATPPQGRAAFPESITETFTRAERALGDLLTRHSDLRTHALVREGRPHSIIAEVARNANLVVMTTAGRRGLDRLLVDSVAETVLRLSPTPVLVLKSTAAVNV